MSHRPNALRVVIADDEAPARSRIRDLLEDCAASMALEVTGEASNGRELIELLQRSPADVVLLDIRMPETGGIEAAEHLRKLHDPPAIIFTTAYDSYALKAFELHAIDYLVKPIRLRRLHDALARVRSITPLPLDVLREIAPEPRKQLSVQERGRIVLIPVQHIVFMRAEQKYVTIRTIDGEHLIEEPLIRLEQEFRDRFVRIHRSCLVSRDHIDRFERGADDNAEGGWVVVLRGLEERLPVSRRQQYVMKEFGRL